MLVYITHQCPTSYLEKFHSNFLAKHYPTTNAHTGDAGCITCHMATPYGYMAGGHNMSMTYSAHGGPETLNTNGCLTCHPSRQRLQLSANFAALEEEVTTKLETLKAQLIAAGIYDTSNDLAKPVHLKLTLLLHILTMMQLFRTRVSEHITQGTSRHYLIIQLQL